MFTQILEELELLATNIEDEIAKTATMRCGEYNSNAYIEATGRMVGLTQALTEIENTQIFINEHVIDILKNTTDGNFSKKLNLLMDENEVLKEKVKMLEGDLGQYRQQKRTRNKDKIIDLNKSIEELKNKDDDDKNKGDK